MWELTRAQKIARLLVEKFGRVSRVPLPITLSDWTPRPTDAERASKAELLARIDAEESVLLALSDEQLDARHRVLQEKEVRAGEARALREELQRPFNLPAAAADFEFWVKADHWTLDEAIALLLGKDPRTVTLGLVKPYGKVSAFARRYLDLRMLAERSALMHHGRTMVRQSDVARWVTDAKLDVPLGLLKALQARYGEPAQQPQQPAYIDKGPSQTDAAPAAPAGADDAAAAEPAAPPPDTTKRWTPDALTELREYRAVHGTKAAAVWAGVSEQRVRDLLPRDKPAPKGYSAFNPRLK